MFVYNFVKKAKPQLPAALQRSKRVMPLAVVLNTNGFSITRSRDMVGEVNFQNLTIKLEEEEVVNIKRNTTVSESANAKNDVIEQITKYYTFGELVTNVHIVQTPEVKKYKANTINVSIDKTGVVLRAGVFRRINYMWKHYSFHLDRYTAKSNTDMVETKANASFRRKNSIQRDRKKSNTSSRTRTASTSSKQSNPIPKR